jgi:hypothetical protein
VSGNSSALPRSILIHLRQREVWPLACVEPTRRPGLSAPRGSLPLPGGTRSHSGFESKWPLCAEPQPLRRIIPAIHEAGHPDRHGHPIGMCPCLSGIWRSDIPDLSGRVRSCPKSLSL